MHIINGADANGAHSLTYHSLPTTRVTDGEPSERLSAHLVTGGLVNLSKPRHLRLLHRIPPLRLVLGNFNLKARVVHGETS